MRQFAGFGTPEDTNAALQDAAGGRRHRPERRLRSADADGPRSGSRAVARRSGEVRRQRHVARRHGDAVRRHPARRHHDVDDDQLAGGDDLRDVSGGGREAGRRLADALGHDPERHPQRVHRAEGIHLPAAPVDAAHHRHLRVLRERGAAVEHDLGQRLPHPRSGRDGAPGAGVHAARRPRVRAVGRRRRARRRRRSCRACRSSSTRTATSSRRSRSTAPRGRSGREAMRDRFGAKNERSWKLRFHSQTAGVSLTAQQPYNNVVRTALQALSAVLGGTNSLHTNSLDEALALPTAEAATLALRTQQIIAHESGVAERRRSARRLVLRREADAATWRRARCDYFEQIDRMGGMVEAIERGFPQKEIAESSYRFQQAVERKEKIIVGVNDFVQEDEPPFEILYIDESAARYAAGEARGAAADARQRRGARARSTRCARAARTTDEPDAADPRRRPRLRDGRRDVRRAARGVGRVRGSADHLGDCRLQTAECSSPIQSPDGLIQSCMSKLTSRHRQAGARRPRPRRQGHRARAARRRHGSDLHRPAADAGDDRVGGAAGRRRRHRPVDSLRRAQSHRAAADGAAEGARGWTTCWW